MSYQIGDKLRITATFKDSSRVNADPDAVNFRFRKPDETETKYEYGTDAQIVRLSVGVYYVDLPLDAAKEWFYRWEAVGNFACAIEKPIQVDSTYFSDLS